MGTLKYIASILILLASINMAAQVGIGTTNPDASSLLDITAADKGILVPRVSLINVTDGTTPITTPAISLLVWNTNAAVIGGNGIGYYYWNGTWEPLFADNLGNHQATTTLNLNTNDITNVLRLSTLGISDYDKLRVWNSSEYTIGMHSAMTYGFLTNWAMTFTMKSITGRGWVFRDDVDSQADGAMSLTTEGEMTVKQILSIPYTGDVSGTAGTGGIVIGGGTNTLRIDRDEIVTYDNRTMFLQTGNTGDLRVDSESLVVDASTNRVGIGIVTPSVALDVLGSIQYTGTITDVSDRRLKENIENITSVINRLKEINGYSYNMIGDENKTREYGVIAQDLQKVFPEMVSVVDNENGYLGVSYIQLIPVFIEAIKEQQKEIDALKIQLEYYKELEERVLALETNSN